MGRKNKLLFIGSVIQDLKELFTCGITLATRFLPIVAKCSFNAFAISLLFWSSLLFMMSLFIELLFSFYLYLTNYLVLSTFLSYCEFCY